MQTKDNPGLTTPKPTDKKSGKTGISTSMDDAPLFAGLDDYNMQQRARIDAAAPKASQVRDKKETVPRQSKLVTAEKPLPHSSSKVQKSPAPETNAMLLSVAEMCSLLKISRATLVRMHKSGQLPGRIKLGGSVRFHRETVETWLQSLIKTNTIPS